MRTWLLPPFVLLACVGGAPAQRAPVEGRREMPVGAIIHRPSPAVVETLWRGSPGGPEACKVVHTGYAGTLDNVRTLLGLCADITGGRMRVIVRPNAHDTKRYVKALLRSPHADLILGWYICDEPFGFPWDVDEAPRPGETRADFWFRYRGTHDGRPPWPAEVAEGRSGPGELTREELASVEYRGGDDLWGLFRQRDAIREAEAEMGGKARCRVAVVRDGGHLPMFGDYGALAPTYGIADGRISPANPPRRRLGYWWYDADREAATWRRNGTVDWEGEVVRRRFGAFGEDVVICNWFSSPNDADGRPRPRAANRIDFAMATIREDAPEPPVWFFLGYGQSPAMTRINMDLAEAEGPVAGYLLWSWGLGSNLGDAWLGDDPDQHWAAMIESRP